MPHLLDANVLISAGKAKRINEIVNAANSMPWWITPQVLDEVTSVPEHGLLRARIRPAPALVAGEAKYHADIQTGANGWKKLGSGEASSIAAAMADQTLVFVTWDRPACWRALHELGSRVLVGHAWLALLCAQGLLCPGEANLIATADPRCHPLHLGW